MVAHDPAGYTADADPNEPEMGHGRWSVTAEEGAWLRDRVYGKTVVEIGTGLGVSTRYMAESAHLVITCDIDPWVRREVWPDLADLDNVLFMGSIAAIVCTHEWPDVVFIDGRHSAEAVQRDILAARAMLKDGGEIILHDTQAASVKAGAASTGMMVEYHNYFHNGLGLIHVSETSRCCS